MLEYMEAIKDLTENEKLMFQAEMKDKSKSVLAGQMACLFLGALGAHRFYLDQKKEALFYFFGIPILLIMSAKFDWDLLAGVIVCFYFVGLTIEVLFMRGRVKKFNFALSKDISSKIKSLRIKA